MSIMTLVHFLDLNRVDPSPEREDIGEVCVANISPMERKKRLRFGIQMFVFTLVVFGIMIALDLNPLWRLSLLFLFWVSSIGCFQARDKT
jgi:hypothetical protein